jgi:hypothetical protein
LIDDNPWENRVFCANYRGDLPAGAPTRGRRIKRTPTTSPISFESLLQAKNLCCPGILIRLEADAAPLEAYYQAATNLGMPLYLGIGAVLLDRNSVANLEVAQNELYALTRERAGIIKQISDVLCARSRPRSSLPWPGDIYIEDINVETSIELIQAVIAGVRSDR